MADKIKKQLSIDAELIPSSGGVFEIVVDGQLIYSKKATGQFPSEWSILEQLSAF
ncbi:MAG: Rdx family protein [Desulfuromonadales bacterium]|nr:Rdx family protein [Desulfuromonadales bacterium]MBN2791198.1 Rdx family protein [Desulfuromonadales bacterium]